ncbi:MAG: diguanylate cyclase [Rhodocyclaceae bacterium]|nr:diguanylate cyclase [Rhodocyclaceae bacterium]
MDSGKNGGLAKGTLDFAAALMEHQALAGFVLDAQGRVLIWNRACERLTGVRAAEVLGTRDHGRAFGDPKKPCLADLVVAGHKDETGELLVFDDAGAAGTRMDRGFRDEGWVSLPHMEGSLYLVRDASPILDGKGRLLAALETLSDLTAQKEVERQLLLLASKDSLTGLASRNALDEVMKAEWNRAVRHGHPLSFIMADIDLFAEYNEHLGRAQGDECLKAVADVLRMEARRPGDLAARYGGEEFAVILPHVDLNGAQAVAERIRVAVLELGLPRMAGSGRVSLSLGATSVVPWIEDSPEILLRSAEQALGRAKSGGRNRVVAEAARMAEGLP